MKTLKKGLTGIILAGLLLTGCASKTNQSQNIERITITAEPVSVQNSREGKIGCICAVVRLNGKYILANSRWINDWDASTEATTLIQSEINDSDYENIEMQGYLCNKDWEYDKTGDRFLIEEVKVHGYEINLR